MPVLPSAVIHRLVFNTTPTAVRKPCSTGPTGQATAPSKSISPDARPRVPSLSFSRRNANPFGDPSSVRGTTNDPSPLVPPSPSSTRAVMKNWSASATEQNHFSPVMR